MSAPDVSDAPPPVYTLHDGDATRDEDLVHAIWGGNLGLEAHMRAKYDWFYLRCPLGTPLVQLLRHEPSGDWVGACSVGRRRMSYLGTEIRGGVLVDLAVLPRHRSLGPALMMQLGLVDQAKQQLDLVLGFPNPKAAAVFTRTRYTKFSNIVRYVRVVRHGSYLARRMPAWLASPSGTLVDIVLGLRDLVRGRGARRPHAEWTDRADPRMDSLWQRSAPHSMLATIRDSGFVRWRFDESPLAHTRHLLISEEPDGPLSAWFTTASGEDGLLHVRDFWSIDAESGIAPRYIDALLRQARAAGHTAVSVEMATTAPRLAPWLLRDFVARNDRPVFGYWSKPPNTVDSALDLHLTAADEDE